MPPIWIVAVAVALLSLAGAALGYRQAWAVGEQSRKPLHSLPVYHGLFIALSTLLPAFLLLLVFLAVEGRAVQWLTMASVPDTYLQEEAGSRSLLLAKIEGVAGGEGLIAEPDPVIAEAAEAYARYDRWGERIAIPLIALVALAGFWLSRRQVRPGFRARNGVETVVAGVLVLCAVVAIATTIGIVLSVLFESIRFFSRVPPSEFLLGTDWQPFTGIRQEQVAAAGSFGIVPLFVGTLLIATIAMAFAAPLGLLTAIYLSEYAGPRFRAMAKPTVEILAGVPTVVYGFFAAITVAPRLSRWGESIGLDVGTQSALAAGGVMAIMLIPFVSSLSDDVIHSVPQKLRNGAYSMGATKGEVIGRVVVPAALPGIVGAFLLAISRAIGETMIVLMAAGLYANLTFNPLENVTTVTVQIATLLTGDQRFDSAKTLSAFALGLTLFVATLLLNLGALKFTQYYRQKYE